MAEYLKSHDALLLVLWRALAAFAIFTLALLVVIVFVIELVITKRALDVGLVAAISKKITLITCIGDVDHVVGVGHVVGGSKDLIDTTRFG